MIEHIITSSVLIIGILFLRMILGNRMSQRLKYSLWLLAAIKLLVPLPMYETNISVLNIVQFAENQMAAELSEQNTNKVSGCIPSISKEQNSKMEEANAEKSGVQKSEIEKTDIQGFDAEKSNIEKDISEANIKNAMSENIDTSKQFENRTIQSLQSAKKSSVFVNIEKIFFFIWIIGAGLCGSSFLISNIRFYLCLRKDRKYVTVYPCKLKVYETSYVNSPCLFGIVKPAIYLPKNLVLEKEKIHHIMIHELTHYKHKDHIWTCIRCLCVVIYWYHPLVWLAAFLSVRDSELACDEGTVICLGEESRKAYGVTLIEMASGYSAVSNRTICSTSIIGGKKEMKKRIEMLVKKPKMLVHTFALFLILVIGVTGCTFSKAKSETNTEGIEENASKNVTSEMQKDTDAKTEEKEENTNLSEAPVSTIDPVAALEAKFTKDVPEGKYYLVVFPDELIFKNCLSGGLCYVPNEEMQKKIKKLIDHPEEQKKTTAGWWEEYGNGKLMDAGYHLCYSGDKKDFTDFIVNSNGTLTDLEKDSFMVNGKLCKLLDKILKEELNYEPVDVTDIKNIVSARLDYRNPEDKKVYSQTIEDKEILNTFEEWFSNGEPAYGGSACPFEYALLTLTMKNGNVIKLSMASDSCEVFRANGVYYEYNYKQKVMDFSADNFFDCFDKIPNRY